MDCHCQSLSQTFIKDMNFSSVKINSKGIKNDTNQLLISLRRLNSIIVPILDNLVRKQYAGAVSILRTAVGNKKSSVIKEVYTTEIMIFLQLCSCERGYSAMSWKQNYIEKDTKSISTVYSRIGNELRKRKKILKKSPVFENRIGIFSDEERTFEDHNVVIPSMGESDYPLFWYNLFGQLINLCNSRVRQVEILTFLLKAPTGTIKYTELVTKIESILVDVRMKIQHPLLLEWTRDVELECLSLISLFSLENSIYEYKLISASTLLWQSHNLLLKWNKSRRRAQFPNSDGNISNEKTLLSPYDIWFWRYHGILVSKMGLLFNSLLEPCQKLINISKLNSSSYVQIDLIGMIEKFVKSKSATFFSLFYDCSGIPPLLVSDGEKNEIILGSDNFGIATGMDSWPVIYTTRKEYMTEFKPSIVSLLTENMENLSDYPREAIIYYDSHLDNTFYINRLNRRIYGVLVYPSSTVSIKSVSKFLYSIGEWLRNDMDWDKVFPVADSSIIL